MTIDIIERNIRRLLLTLLVFFVLSAPPPGAAKNYITWVIQADNHFSFWTSHHVCKMFHDGLIIIRNREEAEKISMLEGWIGLYRPLSAMTWRFTGTQDAKFFLWDDGYPVSSGDCVLKLEGRVGWRNGQCDDPHRYICKEYNGILVQEKKTWEEALVHCRELHGDLVSLPETDLFLLDREALRQDANTDEVWVGLRFLAGEWLWMNGESAWNSSLPQCPPHHLHCGAIAHNDTKWKIMDCSEKRNFLCSKKELHPEEPMTTKNNSRYIYVSFP